ncbi:HEAT repeat domain-containing protein [Ilumatobacter sp.]|uniref:HEAT repeat domain-containing protein n=1 Tax=Ilumatobacter sp. TaxID=1967498 RepID=UPI003B51AFEE
MNVLAAFRVALLVIGSSVVLMTVATAASKIVRTWRERRASQLAAQVRPAVLAAIDDGGRAPELVRRRRAVAESIAISLLPKLRGEDREALATMLLDTGIIGTAARGLDSRSGARRQRCAQLLGDAGHRPARPRLVELLHDRDHDVRLTAARALGRIGDPASVPDLFAALGDRRVPANTASMAVLRIGDAGGDAIALATHDERTLVRSTAAELAGPLGLLSANARLIEMLDDPDGSVRAAAARSLGRLSMPSSVPPVRARLGSLLDADVGDERIEEIVALVTALGQIGHRDAIDVLEASLTRHRRISNAAAEALAPMSPRRSITSKAQRVREIGSSDPGDESSHERDAPPWPAPVARAVS